VKPRVLALHVALVLGLWFFGTLVYVAKFVGFAEPGWFAIDAVIAVACFGVVFWRWDELGIRIVTRLQLVAIIALTTWCSYKVMTIVPDAHWRQADEMQYLATVTEGTLRTDAPLPFSLRLLLPLLAGRFNVYPAAPGPAALAALNFAALIITGVYLVLLIRRLGVRFWLALLTPIFLLSSFLGEFASIDRLVVDPLNYAFYVLLFHAFMRREHWKLLMVLLLLAGIASEKALYWVPVIGIAELLRRPRPWTFADLKAATIHMFKVGGPYLLYLAVTLYLVRNATAPENHSYIQHLHLMSPTWHWVTITKLPVQVARFQTYWFPFGGFTIYALLALRLVPKWTTAVVLMLLPIMVQPMFAWDTERMTAYAFIIYLPLGMVFLEHSFRTFPRWLPPVLATLLVVLAFSQRWLVYLKWIPAEAPPFRLVRLVVSAGEILLIASICFMALVVFREDEKPSVTHEREE
jgi:hypothetical protein